MRFHALQATLGYAFLLVFWLVVKFISALYFLAWAPGILALGFVAFMMKKAFDGEEFKMPIIGRLAFQAVYETADDVLAEAEEEAQAAPKPNEKSGGKG